MNSGSLRRSTVVLGCVCLLCATAVATVFGGAGRRVHWDAADASPVATTAASVRPAETKTSPLEAYAAIWRHPLFTQDRSPMRAAVSDAPDGSIGNLELTGVIVTPGLRMALLRDKDGKNQVRLREGAALPGDRWTLREVASRGVTIERDGERRRLTMKTAAPVRMASAPAAVPPNTPVRAALPQPATTAVPPTDPGVR